ncbi:MAG: TIGR01212 family radical SAM protein, partial [Candidatus Altiarchaeales archaeon]|nr:TIGR01212 family radical SAM protein [Candidatus Altiarchaeales archaeon]
MIEESSQIKGTLTERRVDHKIIDQLYEEGFLYSSYGEYARRRHNVGVFKVPLNAGFTCPNWDGRVGVDGCMFCPAQARQFTYESFRRVIDESLENQVRDQIQYYKDKGAGDKALVYIAFGTNTYMPLEDLDDIFSQALRHEDVIGLTIGTRPDCLPEEVLDLLGGYVKEGYEIWVEVGQQSIHYHTAEHTNRRHGFAETIKAVGGMKKRGILSLLFLIMGMPYESPAEMIETAKVVSALEVDAVKLYPLLVMENTRLAESYARGEYTPISHTDYIKTIADFLEHLSPYVLIQRISKDCGLDGKVAPLWDTHRNLVGPEVEK